MKKVFISFILVFGSIFNTHSQVEEKIEPSYIRTIQFKGSTNESQLPILQLGEPLNLSFDALNGEEADFYYVIGLQVIFPKVNILMDLMKLESMNMKTHSIRFRSIQITDSQSPIKKQER